MSIYDTLRPVGTSLVLKFANENPISHQRPTKTIDAGGGSSVAWSEIGSYKGAVLPISGSESMKLDRNNIEATHAIYLNATDGAAVVNGDRFVFRGRVLNMQLGQNVGEADAAYKILVAEGIGA